MLTIDQYRERAVQELDEANKRADVQDAKIQQLLNERAAVSELQRALRATIQDCDAAAFASRDGVNRS